MRDGVVDVAWVLAGYTPGQFPQLQVTELPFTVESGEEASVVAWRLHEAGLVEGIDDVHVLTLWTPYVTNIHLTDEPVDGLEDLKGTALRTAGATQAMFVETIGASVFGRFLAFTRAPDRIVSMIEASIPEPYVVILLLLVLYVLLGSIFDTVAAMVITLPYVYPLVVTEPGFDPIWWGVVMVMVMEIGMVTPPIGINVFVTHAIARNIPLTRIYAGIWPFLIADVARLALVVLLPGLALALPKALGYM